MKKKFVVLGIHLMVVALVLVLTIVTLAWYTENDTVDTSSAVIVAEPQDNIGLTDIADNIVHYQGQTGLGGIDAPYIATKIISVTQASSFVDDSMTCSLSKVSVTMADGTIINDATAGFENIVDYFTMRVKVVEIDANNQVTNVLGTFYKDENDILVDSTGNKLCFQDENYFTVTSDALSSKKNCSTVIQLELIFLDENSYAIYTSANGNEGMTAFKFSSYDYMGSTFYTTFVIGVEEGSRTTPSEPTP